MGLGVKNLLGRGVLEAIAARAPQGIASLDFIACYVRQRRPAPHLSYDHDLRAKHLSSA